MISADEVQLMLAERRPTAFTRAGWIFELKLDGFRLLAERRAGRVRLLLRGGRDAAAQFPEVVRAVEQVGGGDFILDGELVSQDSRGHPLFQELLKRSSLTGAREQAAAAQASPAAFFAFDLLALGERDLRKEPLSTRKAELVRLLPRGGGRVQPLDHVEREGEALLEAVRRQGLEGVVAKRLDAPYRGGRSEAWLKVPLTHTLDFAVVGHAEDLGALHLATFDGGSFRYAGKVGSGFTPRLAATAAKEFAAHRVDRPQFLGAAPREAGTVWLRPALVAEIRFKNWPQGLAPREPVFLRFRQDKAPRDCLREAPLEARVKITNAKKVLFPEDGITKGELVAYSRDVAEWLLPYLLDRPLLLTRYPDGIQGKSFFQKDLPRGAPSWVRTVPVVSDGRKLAQIVCDDLDTLLWCINLAAIPLHLPAARVATAGRPDWCVIDFDPKGAPFANVVTLARALHRLTQAAGLPTFVKTSGSSGLHVYVPLGGQLDHSGAVSLAQVLARLVVAAHPTLATVERVVKKRGGKVYVDAGQNGEGKVVAGPLCVRPLAGAPVSMPLEWDEVLPGLGPRDFTVRNAVERLRAKGDPMAGVLSAKVALAQVLERLGGTSTRG